MLHVASFDKLRYLKDMDSEELRKMENVNQNKIKLFGKKLWKYKCVKYIRKLKNKKWQE